MRLRTGFACIPCHAPHWTDEPLANGCRSRPAAATATTAAAQQDGQRILCEAFAATPLSPRSFWVFLQFFHQQRRQDAIAGILVKDSLDVSEQANTDTAGIGSTFEFASRQPCLFGPILAG
jgi:hypothetical protein